MITEEVKALRHPANKRLVRMLFDPQPVHDLVHGPDRHAQLPTAGRHYDPVVHEAGVFAGTVKSSMKERTKSGIG